MQVEIHANDFFEFAGVKGFLPCKFLYAFDDSRSQLILRTVIWRICTNQTLLFFLVNGRMFPKTKLFRLVYL